MRSRAASPLRAIVVALAWLAILASPGLAASPGATPTSSPRVFRSQFQAWLDRPLPATAAPGSRLRIGVSLWNPEDRTFIPFGAPFVFRLHPATGNAAPSEVDATQDWQGHYTATVTVPEGGLGALEVAIEGQSCEATTCQEVLELFDLAGVGPPDHATLVQVAGAVIHMPVLPMIAGEPAELDLALVPRADWDPASFAPDALDVEYRTPRGPVIASFAAPRMAGSALGYRAEVTVPDPGAYVFEAAAGGSVFSASIVTATVHAAPAATAPPAGGATSSGGLGPAWLICLTAVLALAIGGLAVRRARRPMS